MASVKLVSMVVWITPAGHVLQAMRSWYGSGVAVIVTAVRPVTVAPQVGTAALVVSILWL